MQNNLWSTSTSSHVRRPNYLCKVLNACLINIAKGTNCNCIFSWCPEGEKKLNFQDAHSRKGAETLDHVQESWRISCQFGRRGNAERMPFRRKRSENGVKIVTSFTLDPSYLGRKHFLPSFRHLFVHIKTVLLRLGGEEYVLLLKGFHSVIPTLLGLLVGVSVSIFWANWVHPFEA